MEELPRVDPNEDPYLAVRTALGVILCLVLAEPLGVTMPMLPALMVMSIMSGQRGALNPRTFAAPVIMPIIAVVFSWIAAATLSEPLIFVIVNFAMSIGGLALMLFRGSRGGMMLTVFPLMMAMSGLYNDQVLAVMRDSMVWGGVAMGIAVVTLNLIFPPTTKRVHEEVVQPLVSKQAGRHLLIRCAVYLPVLLLIFASGDMNMLIVPIMVLFVVAEPRRGTQMRQVIDRGGGTIIGALWATGALALYSVVPDKWVLIFSCGAITFLLIDKMITGKRRPLTYQYTCSAALAMILSSTSSATGATARGALEVVLQRVTITTVAMVGAILLLALLEAIFLDPEDDAPIQIPAAV